VDVDTSNTVSWVIEVELKPGALDAFRALTREMVDASRSEPGTQIYERYLSTDGRRAHIVERYLDSDAALVHLARFCDEFADRFLALLDRGIARVYGPATNELKAKLDELGAQYFGYLDGFSR
jgi:quinol monooxygenase YgiN